MYAYMKFFMNVSTHVCKYICMCVFTYVHICVQENKETYNIDCTPT